MNHFTRTLIGLVALGSANSVMASNDISNMIGTWKWEGFTVKVANCDKTGVCAEVVSGPKNVGLQMIQTELKPSGDAFVGRIAHPQTGDTYNSKLSMINKDTWHIDGCTDNNVCASGDFTRVN